MLERDVHNSASIIERYQPQPLLSNINQAKKIASCYHLPIEDVVFLALNCSGVYDESGLERGRFTLTCFSGNEYRFALTLSEKPLSPFRLNNGFLFLADQAIGLVTDVESDTCTDSYYRRDKRHLTLNSNSRSQCCGCRFCGTYSLERDDQLLTTSFAIRRKVVQLANARKNGFRDLDSIGVVTGCFSDEGELVDHLLMIRKEFDREGFRGEIQYIGAQLRSIEAIEKLIASGSFAYYLSVECFDRREEMMKEAKASLTLEDGARLLEQARSMGAETSFLYIVGLDSIESFKNKLPLFSNVVTRLPQFQTFQVYQPEQITVRCPEACDLDYYLRIRKVVENTFPNLRPDVGLNYRGLWYSEYAGQPITK